MALRSDPTDFEGWAERYLGAKSRHDVAGLLSHFAPDVAYEDDVLCRTASRAQLRESYDRVFANLPADTRSRLVWAAGGESGGALRFRNDAAFFGAPMEVLAAVELRGGLVVRQRDYWDGRQVGTAVLDGVRARFPAHHPRAAGAAVLPHPEASALTSLTAALWATSGAELGQQLAPDAVLRDLTAGVVVEGRSGVVAWLQSVAAVAPYGNGASVSAVVGGPGGGAVEWAARPGLQPVSCGALGVRAGPDGLSELTWVWDGSRLSADDFGRTVDQMGECS